MAEQLANVPADERVTVWFDADCPLCVREIALMRRLDMRSAIDFVDVHGAAAAPEVPAPNPVKD